MFQQSVTIGTTFRTGGVSPVNGVYDFLRHIDSISCIPTLEERQIVLEQGERFPPHKSCEKGVIWKLVAIR